MRRITVVGLGSVLAVLVAAGVVVCVPGRSGPSAPLPPAGASASTVGRAFLDAAVRRDCDGMRALSSPDDTSWCPASLWARWTGEGDPTMHSWGGLRDVSAPADADRCFEYSLRESGLVGMATGEGTWGFCERHTRHGWRLVSEGQA
ncbi:hypothetical protein DEJ34_01025 [Curtobacterium sp. MCPF17_050]|uniref:hypothetical protein n=1 Tax=Curtobacterium sp. MCPF17_050 TaxID=2175664 RepID=UPI000D9FE5D2|nr:hypothetical protein [Curtobacterium sp. MCPF17_050]WIB15742.1 hypothetical protein DEJ34_01025 [Curtobacterium sp. MCPF17_050]